MFKPILKLLLITYVGFIGSPIPLYAADAKGPWDALNAAHSLKCDFGPGISTEWKEAEPNSEDVRIPFEVYLRDIDLQTGKAQLVGAGGSTDVWAKLSPMTVNFVEMSGMWNISVITVYPYYLKGTVDFPAVWSRHQYLADGPLASQFYGTCRVWE